MFVQLHGLHCSYYNQWFNNPVIQYKHPMCIVSSQCMTVRRNCIEQIHYTNPFYNRIYISSRWSLRSFQSTCSVDSVHSNCLNFFPRNFSLLWSAWIALSLWTAFFLIAFLLIVFLLIALLLIAFLLIVFFPIALFRVTFVLAFLMIVLLSGRTVRHTSAVRLFHVELVP